MVNELPGLIRLRSLTRLSSSVESASSIGFLRGPASLANPGGASTATGTTSETTGFGTEDAVLLLGAAGLDFAVGNMNEGIGVVGAGVRGLASRICLLSSIASSIIDVRLLLRLPQGHDMDLRLQRFQVHHRCVREWDKP